VALARPRCSPATRISVADSQHSLLLFSTPSLEIDRDASIPVDGTEMCGLMLRGKFSEGHAISSGIGDHDSSESIDDGHKRLRSCKRYVSF
jgi:hypothetical protein